MNRIQEEFSDGCLYNALPSRSTMRRANYYATKNRHFKNRPKNKRFFNYLLLFFVLFVNLFRWIYGRFLTEIAYSYLGFHSFFYIERNTTSWVAWTPGARLLSCDYDTEGRSWPITFHIEPVTCRCAFYIYKRLTTRMTVSLFYYWPIRFEIEDRDGEKNNDKTEMFYLLCLSFLV